MSEASPIKTILLHVQDDQGLEERVQTALALARAASAHVHCLQITPLEAYASMDTWGGVFLLDTAAKRIDEEEARLRSRIEKRLDTEDVSWDYEQVTAYAALEIMQQAALADLVISGRQSHSARRHRPEIAVLGELIANIRAPLLVPGDLDRFDPLGPAVIAWNGSFEAANAVREAIGLLKLASRVSVLSVLEDKDQLFPNTRVVEYLSRHDIHADLVEQSPADPGAEAVAATIVAHAHGLSAAYLLIGGYSHSRMRERVFGGVTKTLLKDCPLGLVIAH